MAYAALHPVFGVTPLNKFDSASCHDNPRPYKLAPNQTFLANSFVVHTGGLVYPATAGATELLGMIPVAVTTGSSVVEGSIFDSDDVIYRLPFSGHRDATATGGSTTTITDTTLVNATVDAFVGGLVYVHEGPGEGEVNFVTGWTPGTNSLSFSTPFTTAITSASKYIMLGAGAAANDGIGIGSRGVKLLNSRTVNAGAQITDNTGPLVVTYIDPANLKMHVRIRRHHIAG